MSKNTLCIELYFNFIGCVQESYLKMDMKLFLLALFAALVLANAHEEGKLLGRQGVTDSTSLRTGRGVFLLHVKMFFITQHIKMTYSKADNSIFVKRHC